MSTDQQFEYFDRNSRAKATEFLLQLNCVKFVHNELFLPKWNVPSTLLIVENALRAFEKEFPYFHLFRSKAWFRCNVCRITNHPSVVAIAVAVIVTQQFNDSFHVFIAQKWILWRALLCLFAITTYNRILSTEIMKFRSALTFLKNKILIKFCVAGKDFLCWLGQQKKKCEGKFHVKNFFWFGLADSDVHRIVNIWNVWCLSFDHLYHRLFILHMVVEFSLCAWRRFTWIWWNLWGDN